MAKVSYSEAMNAPTTNSVNYSNVGFLSLKNDNDEAVVRFVVDSEADLDVHYVHPVTVNNRLRMVDCLRTPYEPLDNCPLCKNNAKIQQKIYIRCLHYTTDQNGAISVSAKVWERAGSYATKLKSYLDNYGPLSDIICKIIRHGAAGSKETTYEIVPNLSKIVYRDDIYVKRPELFDGYTPTGTAILEKTFDEMNQYLMNGEFPARNNSNQATPRENVATAFVPGITTTPAVTPTFVPVNNNNTAGDTYGASVNPAVQPATVQNVPATVTAQEAPAPRTEVPWGNSTQAFARPRRF